MNQKIALHEKLSKDVLKKLIPQYNFGVELEMGLDRNINPASYDFFKRWQAARFSNAFIAGCETATGINRWNYPDAEKNLKRLRKELKRLGKFKVAGYGARGGRIVTNWNIEYDGSITLPHNGIEVPTPHEPPFDWDDRKWVVRMANIFWDLGYRGVDIVRGDTGTGYHLNISRKDATITANAYGDWLTAMGSHDASFVSIAAILWNAGEKGLFVVSDVERLTSMYSKSLTARLRASSKYAQIVSNYTNWLDRANDAFDSTSVSDNEAVFIHIPCDAYLNQSKALRSLGALNAEHLNTMCETEVRRSLHGGDHGQGMTARKNRIEIRSLGGKQGFKMLQTMSGIEKLYIMGIEQLHPSTGTQVAGTSIDRKATYRFIQHLLGDAILKGLRDKRRSLEQAGASADSHHTLQYDIQGVIFTEGEGDPKFVKAGMGRSQARLVQDEGDHLVVFYDEASGDRLTTRRVMKTEYIAPTIGKNLKVTAQQGEVSGKVVKVVPRGDRTNIYLKSLFANVVRGEYTPGSEVKVVNADTGEYVTATRYKFLREVFSSGDLVSFFLDTIHRKFPGKWSVVSYDSTDSRNTVLTVKSAQVGIDDVISAEREAVPTETNIPKTRKVGSTGTRELAIPDGTVLYAFDPKTRRGGTRLKLHYPMSGFQSEFVLKQSDLDALESNPIPRREIRKLRPIRGKVFKTREAFLQKAAALLAKPLRESIDVSEAQVTKHEKALLKYATQRKSVLDWGQVTLPPMKRGMFLTLDVGGNSRTSRSLPSNRRGVYRVRKIDYTDGEANVYLQKAGKASDDHEQVDLQTVTSPAAIQVPLKRVQNTPTQLPLGDRNPPAPEEPVVEPPTLEEPVEPEEITSGNEEIPYEFEEGGTESFVIYDVDGSESWTSEPWYFEPEIQMGDLISLDNLTFSGTPPPSGLQWRVVNPIEYDTEPISIDIRREGTAATPVEAPSQEEISFRISDEIITDARRISFTRTGSATTTTLAGWYTSATVIRAGMRVNFRSLDATDYQTVVQEFYVDSRAYRIYSVIPGFNRDLNLVLERIEETTTPDTSSQHTSTTLEYPETIAAIPADYTGTLIGFRGQITLVKQQDTSRQIYLTQDKYAVNPRLTTFAVTQLTERDQAGLRAEWVRYDQHATVPEDIPVTDVQSGIDGRISLFTNIETPEIPYGLVGYRSGQLNLIPDDNELTVKFMVNGQSYTTVDSYLVEDPDYDDHPLPINFDTLTEDDKISLRDLIRQGDFVVIDHLEYRRGDSEIIELVYADSVLDGYVNLVPSITGSDVSLAFEGRRACKLDDVYVVSPMSLSSGTHLPLNTDSLSAQDKQRILDEFQTNQLQVLALDVFSSRREIDLTVDHREGGTIDGQTVEEPGTSDRVDGLNTGVVSFNPSFLNGKKLRFHFTTEDSRGFSTTQSPYQVFNPVVGSTISFNSLGENDLSRLRGELPEIDQPFQLTLYDTTHETYDRLEIKLVSMIEREQAEQQARDDEATQLQTGGEVAVSSPTAPDFSVTPFIMGKPLLFIDANDRAVFETRTKYSVTGFSGTFVVDSLHINDLEQFRIEVDEDARILSYPVTRVEVDTDEYTDVERYVLTVGTPTTQTAHTGRISAVRAFDGKQLRFMADGEKVFLTGAKYALDSTSGEFHLSDLNSADLTDLADETPFSPEDVFQVISVDTYVGQDRHYIDLIIESPVTGATSDDTDQYLPEEPTQTASEPPQATTSTSSGVWEPPAPIDASTIDMDAVHRFEFQDDPNGVTLRAKVSGDRTGLDTTLEGKYSQESILADVTPRESYISFEGTAFEGTAVCRNTTLFKLRRITKRPRNNPESITLSLEEILSNAEEEARTRRARRRGVNARTLRRLTQDVYLEDLPGTQGYTFHYPLGETTLYYKLRTEKYNKLQALQMGEIFPIDVIPEEYQRGISGTEWTLSQDPYTDSGMINIFLAEESESIDPREDEAGVFSIPPEGEQTHQLWILTPTERIVLFVRPTSSLFLEFATLFVGDSFPKNLIPSHLQDDLQDHEDWEVIERPSREGSTRILTVRLEPANISDEEETPQRADMRNVEARRLERFPISVIDDDDTTNNADTTKLFLETELPEAGSSFRWQDYFLSEEEARDLAQGVWTVQRVSKAADTFQEYHVVRLVEVIPERVVWTPPPALNIDDVGTPESLLPILSRSTEGKKLRIKVSGNQRKDSVSEHTYDAVRLQQITRGKVFTVAGTWFEDQAVAADTNIFRIRRVINRGGSEIMGGVVIWSCEEVLGADTGRGMTVIDSAGSAFEPTTVKVLFAIPGSPESQIEEIPFTEVTESRFTRMQHLRVGEKVVSQDVPLSYIGLLRTSPGLEYLVVSPLVQQGNGEWVLRVTEPQFYRQYSQDLDALLSSTTSTRSSVIEQENDLNFVRVLQGGNYLRFYDVNSGKKTATFDQYDISRLGDIVGAKVGVSGIELQLGGRDYFRERQWKLVMPGFLVDGIYQLNVSEVVDTQPTPGVPQRPARRTGTSVASNTIEVPRTAPIATQPVSGDRPQGRSTQVQSLEIREDPQGIETEIVVVDQEDTKNHSAVVTNLFGQVVRGQEFSLRGTPYEGTPLTSATTEFRLVSKNLLRRANIVLLTVEEIFPPQGSRPTPPEGTTLPVTESRKATFTKTTLSDPEGVEIQFVDQDDELTTVTSLGKYIVSAVPGQLVIFEEHSGMLTSSGMFTYSGKVWEIVDVETSSNKIRLTLKQVDTSTASLVETDYAIFPRGRGGRVGFNLGRAGYATTLDGYSLEHLREGQKITDLARFEFTEPDLPNLSNEYWVIRHIDYESGVVTVRRVSTRQGALTLTRSPQGSLVSIEHEDGRTVQTQQPYRISGGSALPGDKIDLRGLSVSSGSFLEENPGLWTIQREPRQDAFGGYLRIYVTNSLTANTPQPTTQDRGFELAEFTPGGTNPQTIRFINEDTSEVAELSQQYTVNALGGQFVDVSDFLFRRGQGRWIAEGEQFWKIIDITTHLAMKQLTLRAVSPEVVQTLRSRGSVG